MTKKHIIPLGALVEVCDNEGSYMPNGIRLFVGKHSYDCDGTPLYDLVFDKDFINLTIEKYLEGVPPVYIDSFSSQYHAKFDRGYPAGCLKIIKLPE